MENQKELTKFFNERTKKFGDSPLAYVASKNWLSNQISLYNFYLRKRAFKKLIKIKNAVILDAGCGTGNASDFLLKHNTVYGIDISKQMLKIAQKKGFKIKPISVDQTLPFQNDFFDAVLCLGVIPYFNKKELINIFSEFCRITKPNGSIFLSTLSNSIIRRINSYIRFNKNKGKIKKIHSQATVAKIAKDFAEIKNIYHLYFPFPILLKHKKPEKIIFATNWIMELKCK